MHDVCNSNRLIDEVVGRPMQPCKVCLYRQRRKPQARGTEREVKEDSTQKTHAKGDQMAGEKAKHAKDVKGSRRRRPGGLRSIVDISEELWSATC